MASRVSTRSSTRAGASKSKGAAGGSRRALGSIDANGTRANSTRGGAQKAKQRPFAILSEPAAKDQPKADLLPLPKAAEPLESFDAVEVNNPAYATEYVNDIYKFFREVEGRHGPTPKYMSKQTDINERMRAILIDWLVEVHLKFKLMPQTLYLTVNVLDRFLERKVVSRQKLQLVGCTAMLVASKYEEIYAPEVRDFVYISDRAFTRQELLQMESVVLNVLKFNCTVPTIHTFMGRIVKVGGVDARTKQLATYYVERMLQEYSMLKHLPSTIAAAALRLAMTALGNQPWTAALVRHSRYTEASLQECMSHIVTLVKAGKDRSLQAVTKKYKSSKFLEVALVPLPAVSNPSA